ncbi:DUF1109 domain-containing protein [Paracoccus albus]|uniref:DUF1109 domain-containing protein n=1 Tax=Paracoccus albus TaxID=3017784 RepID=UPI0022F064F7|nr:DUF1109 domain-containing protein [Paracoccus albus]WBU60920.1 DUF1109 domain-containing protein [Paracoccus albus]
MKTEELIAVLAADTKISRPLLVLRLLLGAMLSLALLLTFWQLRPDLGTVLSRPLVLAKLMLPLSFALILWILRSRWDDARHLWVLALPALAAAILFVVTMPRDGLAAAIVGSSWSVCLVSIPFLALPIAAGIFFALRRMVITDPARNGLFAGLMAGGIAATIYALHCNEDAPAFYTVWYSAGILICGAAGRISGRRVLGV